MIFVFMAFNDTALRSITLAVREDTSGIAKPRVLFEHELGRTSLT